MKWFQVDFEKLNMYTAVPTVTTTKQNKIHKCFIRNTIGKLKWSTKICSNNPKEKREGETGIKNRQKQGENKKDRPKFKHINKFNKCKCFKYPN